MENGVRKFRQLFVIDNCLYCVEDVQKKQKPEFKIKWSEILSEVRIINLSRFHKKKTKKNTPNSISFNVRQTFF